MIGGIISSLVYIHNLHHNRYPKITPLISLFYPKITPLISQDRPTKFFQPNRRKGSHPPKKKKDIKKGNDKNRFLWITQESRMGRRLSKTTPKRKKRLDKFSTKLKMSQVEGETGK